MQTNFPLFPWERPGQGAHRLGPATVLPLGRAGRAGPRLRATRGRWSWGGSEPGLPRAVTLALRECRTPTPTPSLSPLPHSLYPPRLPEVLHQAPYLTQVALMLQFPAQPPDAAATAARSPTGGGRVPIGCLVRGRGLQGRSEGKGSTPSTLTPGMSIPAVRLYPGGWRGYAVGAHLKGRGL
jgi:hypothetical protein